MTREVAEVTGAAGDDGVSPPLPFSDLDGVVAADVDVAQDEGALVTGVAGQLSVPVNGLGPMILHANSWEDAFAFFLVTKQALARSSPEGDICR